MTRRALGVAIAVLVAIGTWQLGYGVWIHVKAHLAQHLLQRAWARTLAGERDVKPWPWADTWPVARLTAPAHGVDLIVLAGASGRTLAFGPGHVDGSAVPGDAGTAIVTGHRDTHFAFLSRVRVGDVVVLDVPGHAPAVFRVSETAVVDARTAAVGRDENGSALVLLTCYPFDAITAGGPLRYVVMAERAES
jgi:sortase A